jgi:transcriptional regulator
MGRIVVELSSELEKQFRDEVARRLGMKKGNIKTALEEAIKTWIEKSNNTLK